MRRLHPLLLAALIAAALPAAATTTTVFDNLGAVEGSDPLLSFGPLADSFQTGDGDKFLLSQVTALLKSGSADLVGDVRVSLLADNAGSPGSWLATVGTLSSAAVSTTSFGAYSFKPTADLQLAGRTTYWLQIDALTPNAVEWAWSSDLSGIGVAGGANANALLGVSSNFAAAPYQMSVSVQAMPVPEPASLALMLGGIGLVAVAARRRS